MCMRSIPASVLWAASKDTSPKVRKSAEVMAGFAALFPSQASGHDFGTDAPRLDIPGTARRGTAADTRVCTVMDAAVYLGSGIGLPSRALSCQPLAERGGQRAVARARAVAAVGLSAQPPADRSVQRLIPRRRWTAPAHGWAARPRSCPPSARQRARTEAAPCLTNLPPKGLNKEGTGAAALCPCD